MGEMSEYHYYDDVNALRAEDDAARYQIVPLSMWVTSTGRRVYIPDMEDKHLRNTIRFLRRRSDALVIRYLRSTAKMRSNMGEHAGDAFEYEARLAADGTDHDRCMFAYNRYRALYEEAVKRWADSVEALLTATVEQDK